jgi:hypothetical protein
MPSSFAQTTTFCTLTEERRPQILSMNPPLNSRHCERVPCGTASQEHNLCVRVREPAARLPSGVKR